MTSKHALHNLQSISITLLDVVDDVKDNEELHCFLSQAEEIFKKTDDDYNDKFKPFDLTYKFFEFVLEENLKRVKILNINYQLKKESVKAIENIMRQYPKKFKNWYPSETSKQDENHLGNFYGYAAIDQTLSAIQSVSSSESCRHIYMTATSSMQSGENNFKGE